MLDAEFFRRWMTVTAASVDREAERLTDLDSPIGDADHGSNLQRGFAAVTATLEKEAPDTPGAVLTLDAVTLEIRARAVAGMSPGRSYLGRGR